MKLEVCSFNIQSSIIAQRAGAARVELCDNPVEGGTTPSYGCISETRQNVTIELYPIIRPRGGDYVYDDHEFAIMLKDIEMCGKLQCDGISIGIQERSGKIDLYRLKKIVDHAYPMGVTCNRAFDAAPDPFEALETIIEAGCERILTSGLKTAAPDGAQLLAELVRRAAGRISIMPGAGVRSTNIEALIDKTGASEYHTSARKTIPLMAEYQNPDVSDIGNIYLANEEELQAIVDILTRKN